MKIIPTLLVVSTLTIVSAFSQDLIEAPDAPDDSVTNGPIEAPTASDENVDVDSIEPMEAPAIEAGGQPDQAPEIPNVEVETAPAVDAAPAPETEIGDAPGLP